MTDSETLIASLREAIRKYKAVLADKSGEEKDDLLRVVGQAEAVANFFEGGEIERAKLSVYAFSRQVSDSYYSQPPEFRALDLSVAHIEKYIFRDA